MDHAYLYLLTHKKFFFLEEKIEMLELEIAQLTANEQKLRLEIERLNEVEKNLEELQKDIETLNLKNWLWLRPVLEEYFECTFCMEIYIKVTTSLI